MLLVVNAACSRVCFCKWELRFTWPKTDQALYSLRIEHFNIFRLDFQVWQNDRGYFAFFNDKSWLLHTEIN